MTDTTVENPRSNQWVAAACLFLATLAAYIPAMQAAYIWDDDDYLIENKSVTEPNGIVSTWTDVKANPQFYPLVFTSFWIEHQFWQLKPTGYHIVNIVLHALGALLLWRVLSKLGVPGALVAAAIFALHPVHVESVAWITERKNVLSGVFYMLAMLSYLHFAKIDSERFVNGGWGFYAFAIIFFIAALMSKTITCSLPAVILLILWWKRNRLDWRDGIYLVPMFAIGLFFARITVWMEQSVVGAKGAEWDFTAIDRCLVAGRALWFYAGKIICPWPLMFNYERWAIDSTMPWQYLFPATAVVVIVTLFFMRKKIGKGPVVAVLVFAGTLVPALGFFDVYPFRYSFVADHFQYLASIGIIALVVTGCTIVLRRFAKRRALIQPAAAVCTLIVLGVMTFQHSRVFTNPVTLWTDTLAKNPSSWLAANHLGVILMEAGENEGAIRLFERTLALKPDHAHACHNLGQVYANLNNTDKAIKYWRESLRLNPNAVDTTDMLAVLLVKNRRIDEGIAVYRNALERFPDHVDFRLNYADVLLMDKQYKIAIEQYREVLQREAFARDALLGIGKALNRTDDPTAAKEHLRNAIEIHPDDVRLHNQLGLAYEALGKKNEAIDSFQQAIGIAPNYRNARENLKRLKKSLD